MKKTTFYFLAIAASVMVSFHAFAQRPEAVYVRKAALGLTEKSLVAPTNSEEASKAAPVTPKVVCAACDLVSFTTFSPNNTYISIYGTASIWTNTYVGTTPDPVYPGSFLNFKKDCLNFTHYTDNSWAPMSYWDGFTVSKTKTFPCPLVCTNPCNGLEDQFSSITGGGQLGVNDPYSVAYYGYNASYFPVNHDIMTLDAANTVCGMYITNNAYAYKSMKCGDSFARKFVAGDSLVLYVEGYLGATYKGKVKYYLADFRGSSTTIVNTWKWLNLSSLGSVDKLVFSMKTSDTGPYGPNTPMYFCVDEIKLGVGGTCGTCQATSTAQPVTPIASGSATAFEEKAPLAFVTPNPATSEIQLTAPVDASIQIIDWDNNVKYTGSQRKEVETLSITHYPTGVYHVIVSTASGSQKLKFIKQ